MWQSRIEGPLSLDALRARQPDRNALHVIALGTFDGVHRGHQAILAIARQRADALGRLSATELRPKLTCFTFDRLPLEVVAPERAPARINTAETRYRRLLQAGADHVVVARFDRAFSRLSAEHFVRDILFQSLGASIVVVGYDHTFGYRGEGNAKLLQEIGEQYNIEVIQVDPIEIGQEAVSSSKIRELLQKGDCIGAGDLLGYPYTLEGRVVQGEGRGRTLGYPTANVQPEDCLVVPADGVYLSTFERATGEQLGAGLTIISEKPTFGYHRRTIEGHIFDFDGNLYDEMIRIAFFDRLRGIVRFDGPDHLRSQIQQDVAAARHRLAETKGEIGLSFTLRRTM